MPQRAADWEPAGACLPWRGGLATEGQFSAAEGCPGAVSCQCSLPVGERGLPLREGTGDPQGTPRLPGPPLGPPRSAGLVYVVAGCSALGTPWWASWWASCGFPGGPPIGPPGGPVSWEQLQRRGWGRWWPSLKAGPQAAIVPPFTAILGSSSGGLPGGVTWTLPTEESDPLVIRPCPGHGYCICHQNRQGSTE